MTSFRFPGVVICISAALLPTTNTWALIIVSIGNQPVGNMGWPAGTHKVCNLENRLGYWEGPPFGGGEYHFLYHSDTTKFNQALPIFSEIRSPRLELVIKDAPYRGIQIDKDRTSTRPAESRVDWEMVIWSHRQWHQLYNNPQSILFSDQPERFRQQVPPPRIFVYIGKEGIQWDKVKVPDKLTVIDARDQTNGKGGRLLLEIYDMASGITVTGAKATLQRYVENKWSEITSAEANQDGIIEIQPVKCDVFYRLLVTADRHAARQIAYTGKGKPTENLCVELTLARSLTGFVGDENGKPIEGVEVSPANVLGLDGMGYSVPDTAPVKTGADGIFTINDLPEGFVTLSCRKAGLQRMAPTREVYDVPAKKEIRIQMTNAATQAP